MVYKEHLPWCFDSLASSPTYFLIRCRQAFIRKFFCQGSNFLKSTKVGPKYLLLSEWDFLRKKSVLRRRLVPIIRRGCLWYFRRNPFLFSLNKIGTSLQKIFYISSQEHFVILHYKDHLKRRCSNNQVRGKLSYFLPKFSHERSSKLEMFISTTQ